MKTLEDIAVENGAKEMCKTCEKHLEYPSTFCSGCGMYIKNCLCIDETLTQ